MTDTTDLFKEEQSTPATPEQQTQADPFAHRLQDIRNERGEQKYKDVNTALDGLKHSQEYISQLKLQLAETEGKLNETKSELDKMGAIDDYVKRLRPQDPPTNPPKSETPKGTDGLSEAQITKLLEERLSARDRAAAEEANLRQVVDYLSRTHGDKAAETIKLKAAELGTSPEEIRKLSMQNPRLVLSLFSAPPGKSSSAPMQPTHLPPRTPSEDNPMPSWDRSVVHGGLTNKQLAERWREGQAYTYKRLGVNK